jgi:cobalt-precorrin 5A hydrolase
VKIAIIAITEEGKKTAQKLVSYFKESECYFPSRQRPLKGMVEAIFNQFDGMIFIMSLGIVIRVIAPYLKNKYVDPAVVVVDERKRFAISALSGHEGGANRLAIEVASALDAEPVITTASEAKKKIIVGVGCKRGTTKKDIIEAINHTLKQGKCSRESVRYIATIDLKRDEPGLKGACLELGIPLRVISFDVIKRFNGPYQRSSFVKEKIGVEGVSEPCALLAGRRTKLIVPKVKWGSVCVAMARED